MYTNMLLDAGRNNNVMTCHGFLGVGKDHIASTSNVKGGVKTISLTPIRDRSQS